MNDIAQCSAPMPGTTSFTTPLSLYGLPPHSPVWMIGFSLVPVRARVDAEEPLLPQCRTVMVFQTFSAGASMVIEGMIGFTSAVPR